MRGGRLVVAVKRGAFPTPNIVPPDYWTIPAQFSTISVLKGIPKGVIFSAREAVDVCECAGVCEGKQGRAYHEIGLLSCQDQRLNGNGNTRAQESIYLNDALLK